MVGCYTFVGPTLLIESENFSIAFFQELNINIQTNVLWPSRMKKILITVEIINVYVPKTEFFLFFFSLVWKNFITPSLLSSSRGIQYCTNILGSLYGDCHELLALLQYPKHAMIGYLRVSIQNNPKNRSNYTVSYAQKCYRTKIKLTLAVTNRKCRRNWFKTSHNGEQNNPLGVAKKGGGSGN